MIKYIEDNVCPANDYQRLTKPLIEKRRRARINLCLMQLKEMVIDSGRHKIENPKCKYEKADILELTVNYLQNLHQTQPSDKSRTDQSFTAGFIECFKEVEHFLKCLPLAENNNSQESDPISHKLLSHLENYYRLALSSKQNSINTNNDRLIDERNKDNIENNNNINHNIHEYNTQNPLTANSFSVIHHTSEYSASSPSSRATVSPIPSPPVPQSPLHSSPFSSELDDRPNNLGLYGNERNGHCHQVMDVDGVWRPW